MLDNALFQLIITTLIAGESLMNIAGMPIAQSFQPTQQGVNTAPTIFIHKIGDRRYGSMLRSDVWDSVQGIMVHTESQQYESTFQISTLATQNPKLPNQYTASDIANFCAAIMQSSASITSMQAAGVGIERITDVRNPYFKDDRARNEASPSFDFVLTHKQIITSSVPVIADTTFGIFEV